MPITCIIDGSIHESVESLHALLKKFRIKQETYWREAAPRYNVATGKLIPYKTYDQYMTQDFENKNELKAWIKSDPIRAREWAIEWLRKRKIDKDLKYAPSQAELRTLMAPSMPYYDSIGGYHNLCRDLGFAARYNDEPLRFAALPSDAVIIQDTREQNALKLAAPTIVAKVNEGDYALAAPHDQGVYIERKSLNDFCGTMSKGNARFRRELDRSAKKEHYIVMMVEASITDAQKIEYLPQTRNVRATGAFVMKQMRDLLADYPLSFQVLFVDGRIEAAQKLIKIFELGQQVRTADLQHAYEQGRI